MNDPLHGVTLEKIVTELVDAYGFEELATRVPLRCFQHEPSVPSSLKLLRRTPWARKKVEDLYLFHLREQARLARRSHGNDLRSAAGLVLDATKGVMGVVEQTHRAIGAVPVFTDLAYGALRGVTGVVGTVIETALDALAPLLGEGIPGREREAVLAALNGVVGDLLETTHNPLAIEMSLRPPLGARDEALALHRGGTLLILVHGSSMNDLQWTREGHDHGQALAHDLDVTPAYAHYNSGRHTSTNGRDLAALLERESGAFDDVIFLCHSMGGLVTRAAIRVAEDEGYSWRRKVRALVTLGTPHHGAPGERIGNLVDRVLGATRYSAPLRALGQIRSAGVTDLRYGNVVDADWQGRDRFEHGPDARVQTPLPEGVRCYAIAGTKALAPTSEEERLPGDGIVPVASALGRHDDDAFTLRFTDTRIIPGAKHLDLLARPEVYAVLREWLEAVVPPRGDAQ